jgi:hypothetical protein
VSLLGNTSGGIPPALGNLDLYWLDLSNNQFTGSIRLSLERTVFVYYS